MTQEEVTRLQEAREGTFNWKKWGPYLYVELGPWNRNLFQCSRTGKGRSVRAAAANA
jgi:hypothetical protein